MNNYGLGKKKKLFQNELVYIRFINDNSFKFWVTYFFFKRTKKIVRCVGPPLIDIFCSVFISITDSGEWKIFSGNEIGALLGFWSWSCFQKSNSRKQEGTVV